MKFQDWYLEIQENIDITIDQQQNKIVLLNNEADEIHAIISVSNTGELMISPRWNLNLAVKDKTIRIFTNS
ncbi:hypothetical protein P4284_17015 [Bacillus swezeyi]|uniref:hypothetical protein n=1 Tax=Bacillus swezeyi TaxID=1925020 RepID=UPI002E1E44FD|nr:hypothetical protein [Bacillus swezeyi]